MVKKIKNININLESIPEAGGAKKFTVVGDAGASFMLLVADASGKFYDFKTNTFSLGHTPQKILKKTLRSGRYNGIINFPSVSGQNYDIVLTADPSTDSNGLIINKRIKQLGNTTLTFNLAPRANSSTFKTLPSNITSQGSAASSNVSVSSVDYIIENADTDANGFGLVFESSSTRQNDKWCYFQTTTTVDGAVSSSTTVKVDSLSNVAVGMFITSGASSGNPKITNIDTSTNTLTLSSSQNFSDGASVTIEAQGLTDINALLNCNISMDLKLSLVDKVSTTVRGVVNNSTIVTVNGTYGIPGGGIAVYSGTNVNNSSANTVTNNRTASGNNVASSSAGEIVVTLAQTFKGGEVLSFTHIDSPKKVLCDTLRTQGTISISNYPSDDATIKLDLDSIITRGAAS